MFKFSLISMFVLVTLSSSDWKLKKDEDGIQIYTRSIEGSSFEEFRGIVYIKNSTIPEILDVLFDVENYKKLFPDCLEASIIEKNSKYHQIHYTVTKGPWPVDDRDGVYEMKAKLSADGTKANISMNTVLFNLKERKKTVRLKDGIGIWDLKETDNDLIKVKFQFHGEAGGGVPAWVANTFIVSYPFGTLENLRNRTESRNNK